MRFLLALAALAVAVTAWEQVSPTLTDFEIYAAATDGSRVLLRAGTDREDGVFPLFLLGQNGANFNGSVTQSNLPVLEYATYDNTIGQSIVYLASSGTWVVVESLFPALGTAVFSSPNGVNWKRMATVSSVFPGTLRSDGDATLLILPDEGQSLLALSTDGGAAWTTQPSPFPRGLGPDALYSAGQWLMFRYDLGNATEYEIASSADGQSWAVQSVGVARPSGSSASAVVSIVPRGNGLVIALTDADAGTVALYSAAADASGLTHLLSLPLDGLTPSSDWALRLELCADTGLGLLRFANGSGPNARFRSTDGFASVDAISDDPVQATLAALALDSGCVMVAMGDEGYYATSTDGVEWAVTANGPFIFEWSTVLWFEPDAVFVAIGDASVLTSPDGMTWSMSPLPSLLLASPFVTSDASLLCGASPASLVCTPTTRASNWAVQYQAPDGIVAAAEGAGVWVYADAMSVDGHLYAASSPNGTFTEVYRARGSAISQIPVFASLSFTAGSFWAFAQYETAPKLVRSTDGKSWHDVLRPLAGCSYFGALIPCGPTAAFLQCSDANEVFRWNGGESWAKVLTFANASDTSCTVARCSAVGSQLLMTVGAEVFASSDAGKTFTPVAPPAAGLNSLQFPALAGAPSGTVVALGEFCDTDAGSFIFVDA